MSTGKIGVSTKDLFPIIKKFLYSDHEIFLREIVSNAVDASQKLKILSAKGEIKGELGNLQVCVKADKEAGTLTVSDHGIGMTDDEVKKYINQIAFSGAEEFLDKYKDNPSAIIGHFGLGFYSAFMVSDKVEIITKSYQEGAQAVKWSCKGDTSYTLSTAERTERGTDIIMYINSEEKDFLEEDKINHLLKKYCRFLPIEIVHGKEKEWKDGSYHDTEKDCVINQTQALWTKKPGDVKEEEYKDFYADLYPASAPSLFHIHLNVDYPFNLTGILYFPKISQKIELQKNKIQLYCNQVYVTDSVEGIVPEYLTLLHGVIDSPDIPLNVSRSYLQSDRNVKKISAHITKKVADSLSDIFKNHRDDYESKWDDLKIFIQYGLLTDEKFAERSKDITLLKDTKNKYYTFEEYENLVKDIQTDKDQKIVFLYTTDIQEQYSYISEAEEKGYHVLLLDGQLDTPFINYVEQKETNYRFVRVDSEVIEKLIPKESIKESHLSLAEKEELRNILEAKINKDSGHFSVQFEALGEKSAPILITRSEFMRRMKEMANFQAEMGFYGNLGDHFNLVVNSDHSIVKNILSDSNEKLGKDLLPIDQQISEQEEKIKEIRELSEGGQDKELPASDKERMTDIEKEIHLLKQQKTDKLSAYAQTNPIVGQLIDLALLSNGLLKGEALNEFIKRSVNLIK